MKSPKVVHSKYKNTGILFELLTRQVTADTLSGRENSPALNIIREFFVSSAELGKELQLYKALLEAEKLTEVTALKFIDLVLDQRVKLNTRKLNEQKYHLVRSIKDAYPLKDFLQSKIPNYTAYASIYKLFLAETSKDGVVPSTVSDITKSRFTIVEHMTNTKKSKEQNRTLIESFKSEQEDLRLLTYKILVDRFNEKYKDVDENQKTLLREYINNVSNTNSLREHINAEVPRVKKEIQSRIRDIDDKVIRIKLEEVIKQLDTIKKGRTVRDNQVTALMIGYEIIKEIDDVQDQ
jgi:hypothetical protein